MKCPNCGYTHGIVWDDCESEEIIGKQGDFFTLPIELVRKECYAPDERREVYGCPSCQILFME